MLAQKIFIEDIGHRSYAASEAWVIKNIDDGTRRIRDRDASLSAPYGHCTEQCIVVADGEVEWNPLDLNVTMTHPSGSYH
jgi:hypothetical protein